jgi:chorismate mutase/prephenate dehydratase
LNLEEYRKKIDLLDNKILDLLNERMGLVKKIGTIKSTGRTPIYRPEREKSIIDRLYKLSRNQSGLLSRAAIEAIFLEILYYQYRAGRQLH